MSADERWRVISRGTLLALAAVLSLAGIVSAVVGGFATRLGPLSISAREPARLLMEGMLALLLWCGLTFDTGTRRAAATVSIVLAAYYAALAGESVPRRIGDGHEYLLVAQSFAQGLPPYWSPPQIDALLAAQRARSGITGIIEPRPTIVAADGRHEVVHFWAYPLVVAPWLRLADAVGVNWNHAFTTVNVLLLCAMAYVLARRAPPGLAIALAAGPIIWWVDKAHTESFVFALLATALALLTISPHASLLVLALLSLQNPVFAVVLGLASAQAWHRSLNRTRTTLFVVLAMAIVAVHALYYRVRMGRIVALADTLVWDVPSLTAMASPLVDPLVGIAWYAPFLFVLPWLWRRAPGAAMPTGTRGMMLAGVLLLCVLFATSANVNHAGTPGPSRYGVWLVPFLLCWFIGAVPAAGRRRVVQDIAVAAAVVHSAWMFHPRLAEDGWHKLPLAVSLLDRAPSAYDPLPEVFAERFGQFDGPARLPVATAGCGKVLLVGDGMPRPLWPFPCEPHDAPTACSTAGTLCYANRRGDGSYAFAAPPRQPAFTVAATLDYFVWRARGDLERFPAPVDWSGMAEIPPTSDRSLIRDTNHVRRIRAFQAPGQLIAFVEPLDASAPRVLLRTNAAARAWWVRRDDYAVEAVQDVNGETWVTAPSPGAHLLFVAE
ncbi:MAG: hypothetical protein AB7Q16_13520 [Vicinamibacterales bacterium]